MTRDLRDIGKGLDASWDAFPSLCGRCHQRASARTVAAAVAVPGLDRHLHRAAERYAQPRDDRRTRRLDLAGFADGVDPAGVRAVPRADRIQVRQSPFGAGLAARSLYLDGHAAAVRRLRHPAVRAAGAVGHRRISGRLRTIRRGAGVPAGRRGHAYDPDRRPGAGNRYCARRCAAARGRVPLCDAADRHGRQCADLQRAAAEFRRDPADPGHPGRRRHADAAEHRGALEAGSAQSLADLGGARAAGSSSNPGPGSASPAARSASLSRSRWVPRRSRCRTFCWSRMAPKS